MNRLYTKNVRVISRIYVSELEELNGTTPVTRNYAYLLTVMIGILGTSFVVAVMVVIVICRKFKKLVLNNLYML